MQFKQHIWIILQASHITIILKLIRHELFYFVLMIFVWCARIIVLCIYKLPKLNFTTDSQKKTTWELQKTCMTFRVDIHTNQSYQRKCISKTVIFISHSNLELLFFNQWNDAPVLRAVLRTMTGSMHWIEWPVKVSGLLREESVYCVSVLQIAV